MTVAGCSAPPDSSTRCASAPGGCQVRVLTYSPSRELQPLTGHERIELLVVEAPPGHTLIRAGDQMLETFSFAGAGHQSPPLLQHHRRTEGGLVDRLRQPLPAPLRHADKTITDTQQLDAYLIDEDDEDWEEVPDPSPGATAVAPSEAVGDYGSSTSELRAPRRWPRRTS